MKDETVKIQEQSKITINDVALALGISKTTVSRAISGKGRVSEATRKKVLDYIYANHYKPSSVAKGLATSKTYNIGWVVPGDTGIMDLSFYQRCLTGAMEVAASCNYDILLSMVFEDDISQLEKVVQNRKVDGIILGRTLIHDKPLAFLQTSDIPFVAIGSSPDETVIQIDNDHVSACRELTSILIMKGIRRMALIGGNRNHVVNQTRMQGFKTALTEQHVTAEEDLIFMDSDSNLQIERAVEEILKKNVGCIVCMDDGICYEVLNKLRKEGVQIPSEMKVASFYNSTILEHHQPSVTSLQYDPKELGATACRVLFDYIDGKEIPKKIILDYEVLLKGSTL